MTTKPNEMLLERALLQNGDLAPDLYQQVLKDLLMGLKTSLKRDKEAYIFVVTEHEGQVAMVLIEKSEKIYINEKAREKLKLLWRIAYESNLKTFIPLLARQLDNGELAIMGVSVSE